MMLALMGMINDLLAKIAELEQKIEALEKIVTGENTK